MKRNTQRAMRLVTYIRVGRVPDSRLRIPTIRPSAVGRATLLVSTRFHSQTNADARPASLGAGAGNQDRCSEWFINHAGRKAAWRSGLAVSRECGTAALG